MRSVARRRAKIRQERFSESVRQVEQGGELKPTPDTLKLVHEDICREQKRLMTEARDLSQQQSDYLRNPAGDRETSQDRRRQARYQKSRYRRLERERKRVYGRRQELIIREGVTRFLDKEPLLARLQSFGGALLWLEIAVLVLIVVDLVVIGAEWLYEPQLRVSENGARIVVILFLIDFACCSVFLWEFFLRRRCSEDRRWFWRHNWFDFVSSIPLPSPLLVEKLVWIRSGRVLRVGRMLRLLRLLRIVRGFRLAALLFRGLERFSRVADSAMMRASLVWLFVGTVVGALLLGWLEPPLRTAAIETGFSRPFGTTVAAYTPTQLSAQAVGERSCYNSYTPVGNADAPADLSDRSWWSFTTVFTGGFADIYSPRSTPARLLTFGLVVLGIAVVGIFTATLTSVYVEEESDHLAHGRLERLLDEERRLVDLVERRTRGTPSGGSIT